MLLLQANSTCVVTQETTREGHPAGARVGGGLASDQEKAGYVRRMFGAIAPRYDLLNTLLSGGLHHRWKRAAVRMVDLPAGGRAADVCCGTGDLVLLLARRVGSGGQVVGVDFSEEMLRIARRRAAAAGLGAVCRFVQGDAEDLALPGGTFDAVTMAFGLRNVVHPGAALREAYRILRPGGRLAVLEFSLPRSAAIRRLYDLYSFTVMPWLGRLASRHADAYLYLPTSIRQWPDPDALAAALARVGFERVQYRNLSAGIAAVHLGMRAGAGTPRQG